MPPLERFHSEQDRGDYMCYNYDLDYDCGLSIFVPKPGTNAKPRGTNWFYKRVFVFAKDDTIPFQRNITRAGLAGMITNHYIVNYGKPYQLATHIKNTITWEDAPVEITYARNKINDFTNHFQIRDGEGHPVRAKVEFNEC